MLTKTCVAIWCYYATALHWRHKGRESVSNHQPHNCLLNRLFRHRSKKTSQLRVTGLCVGNSPGTGDSPHKWPVTRKMFPFDDVVMNDLSIGSVRIRDPRSTIIVPADVLAPQGTKPPPKSTLTMKSDMFPVDNDRFEGSFATGII